MRVLYTLGIYLYTLGIRLAALFGHRNARLMARGWKGFKNLKDLKGSGEHLAWFHAASLGEFEQARPVLEAFRQRHPDYRVVVTFFSPSGYEVRKNYAQADAVLYLPMDTPRNARRLIDTLKPDIVFFVKYEFWYNYLDELRRRGIPTYIFSAIFREDQYFFKWYGRWFLKQLNRCFTHLFVQNALSMQLLQYLGDIDHCSIAGDTRFDRVHQIAEQAERNEVAEAFLNGHDGKVLVAGSTWPPDEQLISKLITHHLSLITHHSSPTTHHSSLITHHSSLKLILAPHDISEEHLQQIEKLFPDSIRYSVFSEQSSVFSDASQCRGNQLNTKHLTLNTPQVLLIDNIGLLSKLYRYADVAYIGGGFGVGIHNILEAVTFGKPVLFGPNYHKFQEAKDIIERGGGWSVENGEHSEESGALLKRLLEDEEFYSKASQACTDYMNKNLGSTNLILRIVEDEE